MSVTQMHRKPWIFFPPTYNSARLPGQTDFVKKQKLTESFCSLGECKTRLNEDSRKIWDTLLPETLSLMQTCDQKEMPSSQLHSGEEGDCVMHHHSNFSKGRSSPEKGFCIGILGALTVSTQSSHPRENRGSSMGLYTLLIIPLPSTD